MFLAIGWLVVRYKLAGLPGRGAAADGSPRRPGGGKNAPTAVGDYALQAPVTGPRLEGSEARHRKTPGA
jgi:hypothetical protein